MRLAPMILGFCLTCASSADTFGPPSDYVRPTKGGEYLFVMLTPLGKRGEQTDFVRYPDPVTDRGKTIKGSLVRRFPKSGLYRNDGSNTPLWTVDWYADSVFPVSDGEHLVALGGIHSLGDEGKSIAVDFFRNGRLIKRYLVRDLVPDYTQLPSSTSHYSWRKSTGFDDVGKRLRIELYRDKSYKSGQSIFFDIRTGSRIAGTYNTRK